MAIIFHEKTKEFHLQNRWLSYIFCIMQNKQLGQLYFGKKIKDRESFLHLLELGKRDMAPCTYEGNVIFSLEHLKQEYPTYGTGDMRYPAYQIYRSTGSMVSEFNYESHVIYKGKKDLVGLPHTYANYEDADSIEITMRDSLTNTRMILSYTIFVDLPVVTRSVCFIQDGDEELLLSPAMSINLDLPDMDYDMIDLAGSWTRERYVCRHKLHEGIQSIYSMRGHSSHQFNPFMALVRPDATEMSGEAIGMSLIYSGNFLGQISVDTFGVTRVMLGIHPNGFRWTLHKGEHFQTPEAVLVYTPNGLNSMSQTFHTLFNNHLIRKEWSRKERPILINNWEATFMNFNEEKILRIAKNASELGIELMVMDDGWFGHRDDDTTSLGDWFPNIKKLPGGIKHLAEKVTELGMKFGIWIEPEMVSYDSELYKEHPEWLLGDPERKRCHGRNQYVLDFSKIEVVEYIGDVLEKLLSTSKVSYVKWDMNRSMSEVYSVGNDADYQGEVFHRHILGIYKLYDRLTKKFPDILFESCASGGARFDPGMLYYAPQVWTSDNTDAVERLRIQYGTSIVYPLGTMGAHVSAIPNQQTYRNTSLKTRGDTAYFGVFGYEMDMEKLTNEEKDEIRNQVAFVKKYRGLIQSGTFYRLISPFNGNETAWIVVASDFKSAIVGYYRQRQPSNAGYRRLRLAGLCKEFCYRISGMQDKFYGDELESIGLILSDRASGILDSKVPQGDYQSRIFVLEVVNEN